MLVIALMGSSSVGKTSTLNIVYQMLKTKGYQQVPNKFEDLKKGDFLDFLYKDGIMIGICTQGDFAGDKPDKDEISVKTRLKTFEAEGCHIAICAGTTDEQKIIDSISAYAKKIQIAKIKAPTPSLQIVENDQDASRIVALL